MILRVFAEAVIVVFGLFLIGLAWVAFAKPAIVERFFTSFASSARTHYAEQAIRLLIGTSIVVLSPGMWQGDSFRILGWMIVVTSVVLLLIPWQWHHRFGRWVLPRMIRHMRLYAAGLMVFAVLLLLGVILGSSRISA